MAAHQTCPTCGAGLDPDASGGLCRACLLASALDPLEETLDTTLTPGSTVGVFRIAGVLGKGGMATVYEAYDPSLERSIALKVLPPEFLHDQAFARRFRREAKVIARLEHPNIVPIYASGIDDGIPWMSMRLLNGGSLGALLEHSRPPVERSLQILRKVAEALDYAHARGIVHRDIKPTNILLDGADHVCVADFGLAYIRDFNPLVSRSATIAGTPHYMAPEHGLGKDFDQRADIYSLGVLAYEMLTGTLPFTAESPIAILLKHVNDPLPSPEGVPPPLLRAIHKALAKDASDRWESAGAFVTALEAGMVERFTFASRLSAFLLANRWRTAILLGSAPIALAAGVLVFQQQAEVPASSNQAATVTDPLRDSTPAPDPPVTLPPEPVRYGPLLERVKLVPTPPAPAPTVSPDANSTDVSRERVALPSPQVRQEAEAPDPSPAVPQPAIEPAVRMPVVESFLLEELPLLSDDVVIPPVATRTVTPVYPEIARAAHIVGVVGLRATVGTDGRVTDVSVVRSLHPLLDDAARRALLQYRYSPGLKNGVPQAMTVGITVSFQLE